MRAAKSHTYIHHRCQPKVRPSLGDLVETPWRLEGDVARVGVLSEPFGEPAAAWARSDFLFYP